MALCWCSGRTVRNARTFCMYEPEQLLGHSHSETVPPARAELAQTQADQTSHPCAALGKWSLPRGSSTRRHRHVQLCFSVFTVSIRATCPKLLPCWRLLSSSGRAGRRAPASISKAPCALGSKQHSPDVVFDHCPEAIRKLIKMNRSLKHSEFISH